MAMAATKAKISAKGGENSEKHQAKRSGRSESEKRVINKRNGKEIISEEMAA